MNPDKIREMQEAIRQESLDGWLFCNFRHRDRLADDILGVSPSATNSRLWFYAVPAEGQARGILHSIEKDTLGALPGEFTFYSGREGLVEALLPLAGKSWGCHFSQSITAISFLDAGTADLLRQAGLKLMSAEGLIHRFKGLLDSSGMESHERAAAHLYEIVDLAWAKVKQSFEQARALNEKDIQRFMLEEFARRGLETAHPPIVAAGSNSGNAHYSVEEGAVFAQNDVIQFDLWAKEPAGIYADISWVGVYAQSAPPRVQKAFSALLDAREGALRFIKEELEAGRRPAGADVDRKAREVLGGLGYGGDTRHRTGHGIDTEVHGSGVNIDSVEFPDSRPLLDGSCFSVEPGIYFSDFGMRTEINVYIKDGVSIISGKDRQFTLLYC